MCLLLKFVFHLLTTSTHVSTQPRCSKCNLHLDGISVVTLSHFTRPRHVYRTQHCSLRGEIGVPEAVGKE